MPDPQAQGIEAGVSNRQDLRSLLSPYIQPGVAVCMNKIQNACLLFHIRLPILIKEYDLRKNQKQTVYLPEVQMRR